MFVVATGKADVEDAVGVTVLVNHDVLISTASMDRESSSVISLQFYDGNFPK